MAVCKKCGFKNPDYMQFCGGCGAPLTTDAPVVEASVKKKKKTGLIIGIIAAALVLAALLGVGAWWMFFREKPQEEESGTEEPKEYTKQYTDENLQKVTDYYDEDGKLLKSVSRGTQGVRTTTYTYDENGHVKSGIATGGTEVPEEYTYTCDKDGNIIKKMVDENEYIEYTYEDGIRVSGVETDNGVTYTYTYDANGNMLTLEYKDSYGYGTPRTYTYDASGNLLTAEYGSGYSTGTYAYDANGNMVTAEWKNSDGDTFTTTYTYDASGNVLTEEYKDSYGDWDLTTYTYDASGNVLTEEYKDSYGDWDLTTYTYDAEGTLETYEEKDSAGNIRVYEAGGMMISATGDLAYITDKGTMTIGYTVYPPMNYYDETGELVGFDTEMAVAVCEKLGVEPDFVEINWDTKEIALEAKDIDCIWNGLPVTEDRAARMSCSIPYAEDKEYGELYVIGFRKDSDATQAVNDIILELVEDGTMSALAEKYGVVLTPEIAN